MFRMSAFLIYAVAASSLFSFYEERPNESRPSTPHQTLVPVTQQLLDALSTKKYAYRSDVTGHQAVAMKESGLFPSGVTKVNFGVRLSGEVIDFTNGATVYRSSAPHHKDLSKYVKSTHLVFDEQDVALFSEFNDKLGAHKITRFINLNDKNFDHATIARLQEIGIHVSWIPTFDVGSMGRKNSLKVRARMFSPSPFNLRRVVRVLDRQRLEGEASLVFCATGEGRTGTAIAAFEYFLIDRARSDDLTALDLNRFIQRRAKNMINKELLLHGIETRRQIRALKVFFRLIQSLPIHQKIRCLFLR